MMRQKGICTWKYTSGDQRKSKSNKETGKLTGKIKVRNVEMMGEERGATEGGEGEEQEAPDGRFALPGRVAEEVIKQPFHLRLLG